jgi:hypothetical protein
MSLLIVFGVIVVGILVAVILYYGARFMKGKLALELSRRTASSGEPLSGGVNLTVKKSIRGLLRVLLIGREKQRGRGDRNSSRWVEVYRQDNILEETRDFTPSVMQNYQFELIAPTSAEARQNVATLHAAAEEMGDGVLGSVVKMAAKMENMTRGRIHWHVEARLDMDGVDLYAERKVRVNLLD